MKLVKMFIGMCLCVGAAIALASNSGSTVLTETLASHKLITRDGMLYYEAEGQGEPLILVPGGPGACRISFQPWFSRLSNNHQVVYYDAIGRGLSDRLGDPALYTVERDVDDIENLRQALGVQRISLLGQSYGGIPALAYALKYPAHVSHLVLSSAMISAASFQANIDAANATMQMFYPAEWARVQALRAIGVRSADHRSEEEYAQLAEMMYWHDGRLASLMKQPSDPRERLDMTVYRAMLGENADFVVGGTLKGYDPLPMMHRLAARTLVIGGRYDRVATPEIVAQTYRSIPASLAQLAMFEHSGHRPWVEESDAYFARVSAFLDDQPTPAQVGTVMHPAGVDGTKPLAPIDARAAKDSGRSKTSTYFLFLSNSLTIVGNSG
ncbi:alpha/beta fold hydrolase [Trinickia violacea]|nr:alpha/beta fold hydrolase [Trinickia violacea]